MQGHVKKSPKTVGILSRQDMITLNHFIFKAISDMVILGHHNMRLTLKDIRGSLRWFNTSKGSRGRSNVLRLTSEVNDAQGRPCPSDIGSLSHYKRIGRYRLKVMSRVSEGHTGQMQKLVLLAGFKVTQQAA